MVDPVRRARLLRELELRLRLIELRLGLVDLFVLAVDLGLDVVDIGRSHVDLRFGLPIERMLRDGDIWIAPEPG